MADTGKTVAIGGETMPANLGSSGPKPRMNSSLPEQRYVYQPIDGVHALRMLRICPTAPGKPIHIEILHHNLSDLKHCKVLSYEWGQSPERHTFICQNGCLRVTTNLLHLLLRLRASGEMGLLWIDAICINQDDIAERGQQVALMRDIYQQASMVLIWLGDAIERTEEAFDTLRKLEDVFDGIPRDLLPADWAQRVPFGHYKAPKDIRGGQKLTELAEGASWPAVLDIFQRSYFTRVWILQEVVLSSYAIVMCGTKQIEWASFSKSYSLLWSCKFLRFGVHPRLYRAGNPDMVRHIEALKQYAKGSSGMVTRLSWVLVMLREFQGITNPRDRIYGLLGMPTTGVQHDIMVDYTKTQGEVYRDAAVSMVRLENDILFMIRIGICPRDRDVNLNKVPSWVPNFNDQRFTTYFPDININDPEMLMPILSLMVMSCSFMALYLHRLLLPRAM